MHKTKSSMKQKIILAGLLLALITPAVNAAGVRLDANSPSPALIVPFKTEGGFLGQLRAKLMSNPRTLYINNHYKLGCRDEHSRILNWDPEGGYNGGVCPGGNNGNVHVPEPDSLGALFATGIIGLGLTGYTVGQRRRVHGAA